MWKRAYYFVYGLLADVIEKVDGELEDEDEEEY